MPSQEKEEKVESSSPTKKYYKKNITPNKLVEILIKRTLVAAKKSNDPQAIAVSYGILVDWTMKIDKMEFREKIKTTAIKLLKEIDRASIETESPMKIAMAFGIVMEKNVRGFEAEEDLAEDLVDEKTRVNIYADLSDG